MNDTVMHEHTAMTPFHTLHNLHRLNIAGLLHVHAKVECVAEILGVGQGGEKALERTRPILGNDADVDLGCVPVCCSV